MTLAKAQLRELSMKAPRLLTLSVASLQRRWQLLTDELGVGVEEAMGCPAFFTYSIDSRIAPRISFVRATGRMQVGKLYLVASSSPQLKPVCCGHSDFRRLQNILHTRARAGTITSTSCHRPHPTTACKHGLPRVSGAYSLSRVRGSVRCCGRCAFANKCSHY